MPFHQQTIQRIETGERPPRLDEAHLIARVLDVDLSTMTSTAAPSDLQLRYVVDAVRMGADVGAEEMVDVISSWVESVELLMVDLSARLPDNSTELDPATRWGMAWALKSHEAYEQLLSAWSVLNEMSKTPSPEWTTPSMDMLDQWRTKYSGLIKRGISSEELYESLEVHDG